MKYIRLEQEAIEQAHRESIAQQEAELQSKLDAQNQAKSLGQKLVNLYLLDNSTLNLTTAQAVEQMARLKN